MWNGGGGEPQREEGSEWRGHDGTQVPQWQIESFKESKQRSPLNTKTPTLQQRRNSKASPLRPLQYMGLSAACVREGLIGSRGDTRRG